MHGPVAEPCADRYCNQPVARPADEYQNRDIKADYVSDRKQSRAEVGAEIEQRAADSFCPFDNLRPEADSSGPRLEQAAGERSLGDAQDALAAFLTGLEDLGRRYTFGIAELLLDDERAAQRNGE